jgi:hypothetical protein
MIAAGHSRSLHWVLNTALSWLFACSIPFWKPDHYGRSPLFLNNMRAPLNDNPKRDAPPWGDRGYSFLVPRHGRHQEILKIKLVIKVKMVTLKV